MKKGIIATIITALIMWVVGYLSLPATTIHSFGFAMFIMFTILVWLGIYSIGVYVEDEWEDYQLKIQGALGIAAAVVFAFAVLAALFGSAMFRSSSLSQIANPQTVEFTDVITESEDISDIALMDTVTARQFGERTLGELSDLVSVYDVDEQYTTICYHGRPMKIAALRYDGFFKYNNNKINGIPGYVLVDPVNNTAEYVAAKSPIYYAPSAYFSKDLSRHLWSYNSSYIYGNSFFEIDEEDNCYWITPVYQPTVGLYNGKVVSRVVVTDATTGACTEYKMGEIPEWIDVVIDGDTISQYYNWYGELRNGFWNSVTAQNGCYKTTDDFGYKIIDNDVYIYTGVTSCNNSASATGFILANSRTGEMKFFSINGAEEHSAMSAAEGEVSDYGWIASFPSVINVNGEPVYLMVLKDSNNIVKRYAMVNYKSYNIVAIDTTQKKCLARYNALINGEDVDVATAVADVETEVAIPTDEELQYKTITVKTVQFIVNNGNTVVYVEDVNGDFYKSKFDETWIMTKEGDTVTVGYTTSSEITTIYEVK